jgi:fumarylacetoacetase
MLELSLNGKNAFTLPNGEKRAFLEDGDTVVMRGWCGHHPGAVRIGFGECVGTVLPAIPAA